MNKQIIEMKNDQELAGSQLLNLIVSNLQASRRVFDLALNLHMESLNVGIKTARMGVHAKTFVPISAEIGDAMKKLKKLTANYQMISEEFIHSIAALLKTLRVTRLFKMAINKSVETRGESNEYFRGLKVNSQRLMDAAFEEIDRTGFSLARITAVLRDIAFSGKYTSDLAKIESVRMQGVQSDQSVSDSHLADASIMMSKCLIELSKEVESMDERLKKCQEILTEFNYQPKQLTGEVR